MARMVLSQCSSFAFCSQSIDAVEMCLSTKSNKDYRLAFKGAAELNDWVELEQTFIYGKSAAKTLNHDREAKILQSIAGSYSWEINASNAN